MYRRQRIRDPLHNLIEFQPNQFENAMWNVIQSRPFQRLRRIKQLGFSDFVYPGATHSRFAHSVGVFHTSRFLMKIINEYLGERRYDPTDANQALAAALVHDLGHGPFSHSFEEVGKRLNLKMTEHEQVSDVLIRQTEVAEALSDLGSGFANDVADVVKNGPATIYSAVVSSQFDADRLDYMRRDRLMTGTDHGSIDFQWLLANIEIGEVERGVDEKPLGTIETFVLGSKALYAAETFVLSLFQLYPTVYFHKTTRGAEKIFTELMIRVISLVKEGSIKKVGLPAKHPLVQFAKKGDKIEEVLCLDDTVIWGSLSLLADAEDSAVEDLSRRLRDRKLYKCIDVRERLDQKLGPKGLQNPKERIDRLNRGCASISEKVDLWLHSKRSHIPRILTDRASRVPYNLIQESKGPLNQIRIKTDDDKLVDLGERSKVVNSIETFHLHRLYIRDTDDEARELVESLIRSEVPNA